MPKCLTCNNFFGPNFCVIKDENKKHMQCVFFYTGKNEITLQREGKPDVIVKKEDAIKNYKIYLKKLYESKSIQNAIKPKSNIIIP